MQNNPNKMNDQYKSPCSLFLEWSDKSIAYNTIHEILEQDEDIFMLFKYIFGTNGKIGISLKGFKEFIILSGAIKKKEVQMQYDPIRLND